jgi:hypothetical protein
MKNGKQQNSSCNNQKKSRGAHSALKTIERSKTAKIHQRKGFINIPTQKKRWKRYPDGTAVTAKASIQPVKTIVVKHPPNQIMVAKHPPNNPPKGTPLPTRQSYCH